ncbi:MAG TPA: Clp1/GlmU family protein [Allosphingosinicella sp.]|jgi:polynucleotide 5'-hydroxyl-kinase GRC3/NOL9
MRTAGFEIPAGWAAILDRIARREKRRVVVIGPTDAGKSSFVRAALGAAAEASTPLSLIDLDPGQKMLGPPGTASLGDASCLRRFIFLGSTSASEVSRIVNAAGKLAEDAAHGFIVNTSGFVRGLGARLQAATIARIAPDLLVVLGDPADVAPVLEAHGQVPAIDLGTAPAARRKAPSERSATRQAAFAQAMGQAEALHLNPAEASFDPAPPAIFEGLARPVCALLDGTGEAMSIGIVVHAGADGSTSYGSPPPRAVRTLQLGKMWAAPSPKGWELLDRLSPSWRPNAK